MTSLSNNLTDRDTLGKGEGWVMATEREPDRPVTMLLARRPLRFGAISRDIGVMVRTRTGTGGIRKLSGSGKDAG